MKVIRRDLTGEARDQLIYSNLTDEVAKDKAKRLNQIADMYSDWLYEAVSNEYELKGGNP